MENRRLSLLYNLQNLYNSSKLGSIEHQISGYLIENYRSIDKLNIFEVADENHVSRATIRRFCENLGYSNFKDLKQHFLEFDEGINIYKSFYWKEDFLHSLTTKLHIMFYELEDRLANRELNQIIDSIISADEVVVVASSTVSNSVRVFQQTMAILGKKVSIVVSAKELEGIKYRINQASLVLIFSISGALAESIIDNFKGVNSKTYLFTNSRSPLFNKYFSRVYHLTSMENKNNNDVIYYTYGITFVLDSIINEYSKNIE